VSTNFSQLSQRAHYKRALFISSLHTRFHLLPILASRIPPSLSLNAFTHAHIRFIFEVNKMVKRTAKQLKTSHNRKLADKKKAKRAQNKADREAQFPDGINPAGHRPPIIKAEDIVDWLRCQENAPYPLETSNDTMLMWFEVMDTGISTGAMGRRLGEVMSLWREKGDPNAPYTLTQQTRCCAVGGPDMTPPVVTVTWQEFQRAKQFASAHSDDIQASPTTAPAVAHGTTTTSHPSASLASDTADASLVAYYLA
jgi:hypothetical protein